MVFLQFRFSSAMYSAKHGGSREWELNPPLQLGRLTYLPMYYTCTRTAAVINEMLRGFPGFHSRNGRWVIKSLPAISHSVLAQSRQRDLNPQLAVLIALLILDLLPLLICIKFYILLSSWQSKIITPFSNSIICYFIFFSYFSKRLSSN